MSDKNNSKNREACDSNLSRDKELGYLTQLNKDVLVQKNSDVIKYRGMLDYSQAKVIELQIECDKNELYNVTSDLESVLKLLRELMICNVLLKPMGAYTILDLSEKEVHNISHNPMKYFGVSHRNPSKNDGEIGAKINTLRTIIRQTELIAIDAYGSFENLEGDSCIKALNRLSSAIYVLYLRYISGYYNN